MKLQPVVFFLSIFALSTVGVANAASGIGPHALDEYHSTSGFTPDTASAKSFCKKEWDENSESEQFRRCLNKQKAGQSYLYLYAEKHGITDVKQLAKQYQNGDKSARMYGGCIQTHNPDSSSTPDMHMIGWCVLNRSKEHLGGY